MRPGWLAHPVLSLLLAATWLLLQQSLAPGHLITAAALGLLLPRLLRGFLGAPAVVRSWPLALRLLWVVLVDIVMANLTVARIVLLPGARPQPAWLTVPLEVEDPLAITLFAAIITMTPGTVSCVVDPRQRHILVHALDCSDAGAMVADMKQRYEAPLKEILG